MTLKFNNIENILIDVLENKKKVNHLIDAIKKTDFNSDDLKYAYQAFSCALLAKEAEKVMQKVEYLQSYYDYITKAFTLNPNCFEGRLFRFLVEKEMTNVQFTSHYDEDTSFIKEHLPTFNNEIIKKIAVKNIDKNEI